MDEFIVITLDILTLNPRSKIEEMNLLATRFS